jgi:hypothetical protein
LVRGGLNLIKNCFQGRNIEREVEFGCVLQNGDYTNPCYLSPSPLIFFFIGFVELAKEIGKRRGEVEKERQRRGRGGKRGRGRKRKEEGEVERGRE